MLKAVKKTNQKEKEEGFVVDSDKKATWCLRKIKNMKQKQKKNENLAESLIEEINEEIEEIKAWLDKENKKLQGNIDFMKNKLHNYALDLKDDNPDLKTHNLPFGALTFRKQRPKWKYDDEKLVKFVESNLDDVLKVKKKVNKRELKKKAKIVGKRAINEETGEVINGVRIIQRPEKFKVKVDN